MCSWYHGSISRRNAEQLLRMRREGSYLVRTSESNKLDYSLSVRSDTFLLCIFSVKFILFISFILYINRQRLAAYCCCCLLIIFAVHLHDRCIIPRVSFVPNFIELEPKASIF